MINTIKNQFQSEENRRLLSNFFSLVVLQGANYILPLITIPYLIRVLGVEYFGLLAFATATVTYFSIITDYGFNLTATKEVSVHRDNHAKIIEIFSSVMSIKVILMLFSFLLLSILVFSFERFSEHWEIYFLTFGTVIGQVLFPVWFFQGMEQMKYITYLNILAKSIFTVAIFLFVKEQNDFWIVPLLTSIGFIIAGVASLFLIKKEFSVKFELQKIETLKVYFIDGWHIFLSRIYLSLYTTTNVIILGLFTNNTVVGYYAIAEKIVVAIGGLFEPINQTIYPYLAKKYKDNFPQFTTFVKKISLLFLAVSSMLTLIAYIFKDNIVHLITGDYNVEVSLILGFFLLRVITYPFGALFSNSLIIMNQKKFFMKVMNLTVIFNLLIVPISIYLFGVIGLVISFLLVTLYHTVLLLYYVNESILSERAG